MEKERSNIQNLSVCYCLMKRESSNQTGTVRMSPMTEMLNHVQAFYENNHVRCSWSRKRYAGR